MTDTLGLVRNSPALTLAVKITRVASIDALNGDREALAWLLAHPLPRMALEALDINAEVALGVATFPGAIWSSG